MIYNSNILFWLGYDCKTSQYDGEIFNQKTELTETTIAGFMLEFCNLSLLQDTTCKTTRVLHTHLPYRFLSTSKLIGQCKIIVIVRNPKDTCVSYHNHSKKDIFINYDISWNEFFEKWMTEESKYHFQNFRIVCKTHWYIFRNEINVTEMIYNSNILFWLGYDCKTSQYDGEIFLLYLSTMSKVK
jgi:hypothetical protein